MTFRGSPTAKAASVVGATGSQRPTQWAARRFRAILLFVAGVLVFADSYIVAMSALVVVIAMLLAIGFIERRLVAIAWAATLVAGAFVGDVLWQLGWAPYDRSTDYESIPQTPFVVIGLPIPMALIAVGVLLGTLFRRLRQWPGSNDIA